jgi:hypothetical protein
VQVAIDDSAFVQGMHRLLHLAVHGQRPVGVAAQRGVVGVRIGERVRPDDEPVERLTVDVFQRQELVVAQPESVVHPRRDPAAGDAFEHLPLPAQPGDRIVPAAVQPGVRTGLLEDDPLAGPGVLRGVEAAGVGVVQDLGDLVLQVVRRHGVAGVEVRLQERRQADPVRHAEGRLPPVRFEGAVRGGDGGQQLAVLPHAVQVGEGTEPHVERAVGPAQVAENVGSGLAGERRAELGQHGPQGVLVDRIDGGQFAAGGPRRIFRIAHEQHLR